MISLSQAAKVPCKGSSPDASSSGPVCMLAASGPGREGAGLGCAAVEGVVSEVPNPRLCAMSSSVVHVASLRTLCACVVARLGSSVHAASGSPGGVCAATVSGVAAMLTSFVPASQSWVPLAACAGASGGVCGCSGRCCGAAAGLPSRERCNDGAHISVAVPGVADGSCGPGAVVFVVAWQGVAEQLDAVASAVPVCALKAAKRARSVGGSMAGIGVRSVRALFPRRLGSGLRDICSVGWLSSPA